MTKLVRRDQRFLLSIAFGCISFAGCVSKQDSAALNVQNDLQQSDSIDLNTKPTESDALDQAQSSTEIKIFKNGAPLTGFGYDIYLNGKLYVHQPNVPAIQGNFGFKTSDAAYKTAGLVLYKIKKNILPPSIELKELDSLGVLK